MENKKQNDIPLNEVTKDQGDFLRPRKLAIYGLVVGGPLIALVLVILKTMGYEEVLETSVSVHYLVVIAPAIAVVLYVVLKIMYKQNFTFKILYYTFVLAIASVESCYILFILGVNIFWVVILYPITVCVLLIIIFSLAQYLQKPVNTMADFSKSFAKFIPSYHNLSYDSNTKDNDMLVTLVSQFRMVFNYLESVFNKNNEISQDLQVMAEELFSSTEEISNSSENIASTQQQISKGANSQVMAINQVQKQILELNNGMKDTRQKIKEIAQVSEFIDEIADQTNMLALNAAIEAARAGESGSGFNVVAEQVRKLAGQAQQAVESTNVMIKQILEISKIQQNLSLKLVEQIDMIATVAEETSSSTEESAAAAEEQASSMVAISNASHQLLNLAENLMDKNNNDNFPKKEDLNAINMYSENFTQNLSQLQENNTKTFDAMKNVSNIDFSFPKSSEKPVYQAKRNLPASSSTKNADFKTIKADEYKFFSEDKSEIRKDEFPLEKDSF